jgi:group I intron endonuclease
MEDALKRGRSHIYNAILKHGYSNFSLEILEYCSPEQCIEREDFYLSSLPHEYNILPKAGSSFGFKHSEKTKKIISEAKKGENHPNYGKPRYEGALRFFNKKDVPLKQ